MATTVRRQYSSQAWSRRDSKPWSTYGQYLNTLECALPVRSHENIKAVAYKHCIAAFRLSGQFVRLSLLKTAKYSFVCVQVKSKTAMAAVHESSGARTGNGHPQKSQPRSQNPLAFHFGGLQNLLKLRTTYRFNEKLSALVGADLNLQQESAFPVATLQYEVWPRPSDPEVQHEQRTKQWVFCRSLPKEGTGVHCKQQPQAWYTRSLSAYTRGTSAANSHLRLAAHFKAGSCILRQLHKSNHCACMQPALQDVAAG